MMICCSAAALRVKRDRKLRCAPVLQVRQLWERVIFFIEWVSFEIFNLLNKLHTVFAEMRIEKFDNYWQRGRQLLARVGFLKFLKIILRINFFLLCFKAISQWFTEFTELTSTSPHSSVFAVENTQLFALRVSPVSHLHFNMPVCWLQWKFPGSPEKIEIACCHGNISVPLKGLFLMIERERERRRGEEKTSRARKGKTDQRKFLFSFQLLVCDKKEKKREWPTRGERKESDGEDCEIAQTKANIHTA